MATPHSDFPRKMCDSEFAEFFLSSSSSLLLLLLLFTGFYRVWYRWIRGWTLDDYRVLPGFFFPSIRTAAWKMHVMAGRTCGSQAVNKTKQNKKITRGASFFFLVTFFSLKFYARSWLFFFSQQTDLEAVASIEWKANKKKRKEEDNVIFLAKKKEKKRKKGRRKTIRGLSGPFFLWVMRVSHKGSIATESSTSSRVKGKVVNMQMSKSIDGNWWAKISNLVESRYDWQGFKKNPKKNNSDSWTIMDTIKS